MVYDIVITVMGMIHGFIGVAWMGLHVTNLAFVVPEISKAQKLADAPMMRNLKRLSMMGMVFGILTLLSGLTFMFIKWGFDFSIYSQPEPRTVVFALVTVSTVLVFSMSLMRPMGMRLGKAAAGLKPMDDLPADFKADLQKMAVYARIAGGLVALSFMFMILAINGGV